ncbi:Tyrosine recombinase XerC [subsurface metagenome]
MKTEKAKKSFLEAKQDLSPRTLEQYSQALDYLERECPKMPKKPEPIREALNKAPTIWVKDVWWRVWSVFFHWCRWEYDIPNPMERVERPKPDEVEMRVLEPKELAFVLAAANNLQLKDKAIVALALDSGIRASEFGRLRVVDIGTDTIWVWGKGRKQAKIPVSPEARQLLQLLVDQNGKNGPRSLLFAGKDGQPLSRFAVYRIARKCMDMAGIAGPKRGTHLLRHSLGTQFIAGGGDPFTLKRIMRHRDIATTQKYVNLATHTLVEHHRLYSPLREAIRGAQQSFFDTDQAIKEAESIISSKGEAQE